MYFKKFEATDYDRLSQTESVAGQAAITKIDECVICIQSLQYNPDELYSQSDADLEI